MALTSGAKWLWPKSRFCYRARRSDYFSLCLLHQVASCRFKVCAAVMRSPSLLFTAHASRPLEMMCVLAVSGFTFQFISQRVLPCSRCRRQIFNLCAYFTFRCRRRDPTPTARAHRHCALIRWWVCVCEIIVCVFFRLRWWSERRRALLVGKMNHATVFSLASRRYVLLISDKLPQTFLGLKFYLPVRLWWNSSGKWKQHEKASNNWIF